jgi:NAD(P)H-dependent FMN reductase
MTKQVIIVLGSPRKNGNCAVLAEQVAAGVRASGAKVDTIYLQGLTMEPCNACDVCQAETETDCIIDDELTAFLPRLRQADALLLAGPVYWFTFTAQTKLFIDRAFYALNGPQGHALKGKPIGLIMTYADIDPFVSGAVNALRAFQDICRFIEAPVAGMIYGSAVGVGDIQKQPDLLQKAYQLGQQLGSE